jgi:hypothetical protein
MTSAKDLLGQKADSENELSYTDKQVRIIETALANQEMSAADIHRELQKDWDDAPSQGYIYNVLQRATSEGYKLATGQVDESEQTAGEDEEENSEAQPKAEEKESESGASAAVQRSGGTITINITLPEDAGDVEVEVEGDNDDDEVLPAQ